MALVVNANELLDRIKKIIQSNVTPKSSLKNFEPRSYECHKDQLLIDCFTRIINDESSNTVVSAQFYVSKEATNNPLNQSNIDLIHLSANNIDSGLLQRSKAFIEDIKRFQAEPSLDNLTFNIVQKSYLFKYYSIGHIAKLITYTERILHFKYIYRDDAYNIIDPESTKLKELLKINFKLKDKRISLNNLEKAYDFLDLSLKLFYEILYLNGWALNFAERELSNKSEFAFKLYVFRQSVWDAFSFVILSKRFFSFKSCKLNFGDLVVLDKLDIEHDEVDLMVKYFSGYDLYKNYVGVSKPCCPLCEQVLSCLGYEFRGTHGLIRLPLFQWKVPVYLDEKSCSCLFHFLEIYTKLNPALNISILNPEMQHAKPKTCKTLSEEEIKQLKVMTKLPSNFGLHSSQNLSLQKEITKFDKLLLKENQHFDNIRPFKKEISNVLEIYEIEWIFKIHTYLESLIDNNVV